MKIHFEKQLCPIPLILQHVLMLKHQLLPASVVRLIPPN